MLAHVYHGATISITLTPNFRPVGQLAALQKAFLWVVAFVRQQQEYKTDYRACPQCGLVAIQQRLTETVKDRAQRTANNQHRGQVTVDPAQVQAPEKSWAGDTEQIAKTRAR